MKLVIDANVWIAARFPSEPHSVEAGRLLVEAAAQGHELVCPVLLLAEVACTAARKCRDALEGIALMRQMQQLRPVAFLPLDDRAASEAAELGARLLLRSADAVYVAATKRANGLLITYDQEVRQRAATEIRCLTPAEWLERL